MSFILDALKKSENDRQRQSGPALFEVRVAPPRSGFPTWAIALLALLVVNLVVVGWLMLRRPAAAATPQMQASVAAPAAAVPPPVQPAVVAPPVAQAATPTPSTATPATAMQPAPPPPQAEAPALTSAQSAQENAGTPQPPQAPPPEERFTNTRGNPDDYAPASEPSGDPPFGHVRRGLDNGLMTYEEAASKNTIPPLHMDLHVYAPDPRKRFVLVNSKRLFEGESLPEGVRVDSITSDGAILSYRGVQFMMERQ